MKKIKLFALPILVACVVLCFSFALITGFKTANADVETVATYKVVEGSQVRTEQPTGMRFITEISDAQKTQFGEDAEYGVIILPVSMLDGELTHSVNGELEIKTLQWRSEYNKADYSAFNSVLGGKEDSFPESFYNVPFAVTTISKLL